MSPIMGKERELTESQVQNLPVSDFNSFCEQLYAEGLDYNRLPEGSVEQVGKITSILLHGYPGKGGRWISIHFRESLGSLGSSKTLRARARDFLINLGADLHILAERLKEDLRDVDMIYGLTQLSAAWGENHGFSTKKFTQDPEITRSHCESITGLPPQTNDKAPLTLFAIGRDVFIEEFHRVSEVTVADSVNNETHS